MKKTIIRTIACILPLAIAASCGGGGGGGGSAPTTTVYRAYVANPGDNNVISYTIDRTTGKLTSTGTTTAGAGPDSVVVDAASRFAYVANISDHTISAFAINAATGALTSVGTGTTGGNTIYVNIDPLSRFAYAPNWNTNDIAVFTINPSSGALTKTHCGGGAGCNGMNFAVGASPYSNTAFDRAGKYAYVAVQGPNVVRRYAIDQTTGALSSAITATAGTDPQYVVIHPLGAFAYVANGTSNDISAYTVSAATGTLSQIDCGGGAGCNGKNFAAGAVPMVIAIDPTGKFLYVSNYNENTVSGYTINGTTGALTLVAGSPYSLGAAPFGAASVATDPSGSFLYATCVSGTVLGYSINGTTGVLTPLASSPFAGGASPYFISTVITTY